jgi:hypothetical protein
MKEGHNQQISKEEDFGCRAGMGGCCYLLWTTIHSSSSLFLRVLLNHFG